MASKKQQQQQVVRSATTVVELPTIMQFVGRISPAGARDGGIKGRSVTVEVDLSTVDHQVLVETINEYLKIKVWGHLRSRFGAAVAESAKGQFDGAEVFAPSEGERGDPMRRTLERNLEDLVQAKALTADQASAQLAKYDAARLAKRGAIVANTHR